MHCSNPPYICNFIHQTFLQFPLFQDPFQRLFFFWGRGKGLKWDRFDILIAYTTSAVQDQFRVELASKILHWACKTFSSISCIQIETFPNQHFPIKRHFSNQIPLKALHCSLANVIEVISICSFSLSAIWLSRGTKKNSCSAACHSPSLEDCSLVPRTVYSGKIVQIHSPDAKLYHSSEDTVSKLVSDSWRYSIAELVLSGFF